MAIILIRTLIVYFTLLISMRLLGKRQMGELELSEFVVAALVADMAAHPLQDIGIPMINGLVPVLTMFCCEVLIAGISMRSIRLRSLLFGKPSMLVHEGRIDQRQMYLNRFTPEELLQELRRQGIYDLSSVRYALLETDGTLNVMLSAEAKPATAKQLGISTRQESYPSIVINKGRILHENLSRLGLDTDWLRQQLNEAGAKGPEDIYLMVADREGLCYLAEREMKK